MSNHQKGNVWVAVVVVLIILAIVAFTWWSVSGSEKRSSEILRPAENSDTDTQTE